VLAHGLKSLVAPTSLKNHTSIDSANKLIWDEAYNEEYDGFVSLLTWEVVSEAQYHQLSKGKHALHTMVIAIFNTMNIIIQKERNISGAGKLGLPYLVKRRYSCTCIITIGTQTVNIIGYL